MEEKLIEITRETAMVDVDTSPHRMELRMERSENLAPQVCALSRAYSRLMENYISHNRDNRRTDMWKCIDLVILAQTGLLENDFVDLPVSQDRASANTMSHLYLRGWVPELKSEYTPPSDEDPYHRLKYFIRVTTGEHHAKYWEGPWTFASPDTIMSDDVTAEQKEAWWLNLERFSTPMADVAEAHQLIGDLSEGVLMASYNEDDIRERWMNKTLNESVRNLSEWEVERFQRQMGDNYREDGDYESLLTKAIAKINGWPDKWSSIPSELSNLTVAEQLKVLPDQLLEPYSRQSGLNRYCKLVEELTKRLPA